MALPPASRGTSHLRPVTCWTCASTLKWKDLSEGRYRTMSAESSVDTSSLVTTQLARHVARGDSTPFPHQYRSRSRFYT